MSTKLGQVHLVREILLEVEKAPANRFSDLSLPDRDENQVFEHVELLLEAGMIVGKVTESGMGDEGRILAVDIHRLTWDGHEFLDNARNDTVWAKTKLLVMEKGGSASFAVVKGLLAAEALRFFGLSP